MFILNLYNGSLFTFQLFAFFLGKAKRKIFVPNEWASANDKGKKLVQRHEA